MGVAGRCLRYVFCVVPHSSVQLCIVSAFIECFLLMESCSSKCKIHVILIFFPNIPISLEQTSVFKTDNKTELTYDHLVSKKMEDCGRMGQQGQQASNPDYLSKLL